MMGLSIVWSMLAITTVRSVAVLLCEPAKSPGSPPAPDTR